MSPASARCRGGTIDSTTAGSSTPSSSAAARWSAPSNSILIATIPSRCRSPNCATVHAGYSASTCPSSRPPVTGRTRCGGSRARTPARRTAIAPETSSCSGIPRTCTRRWAGPASISGLQDAMNLGWKLAAAVHGWAPQGLLDSYHTERHPVGERVMMQSMSQTALMLPGPEIGALRELFKELLQLPDIAAHMAHLLAGSDVRYDIGNDHPMAGRLVPDLTLDNGRRVADLMRAGPPGAARPVRRRRRRCRRPMARVDVVDPSSPPSRTAVLRLADSARRLRGVGGRHVRNRRRGAIAGRASTVVRCQRRSARRTTPG